MSRVSHTIAACLLIIIAISLLNQNPYYQVQNPPIQVSNPLRPYIDSAIPIPPFPSVREAYSTWVWKTIEGANITDVVSKAKASGYNATRKEYIWEWAYGKGTIYELAQINYEYTSMALYYDRVSNLTHVQFFLSESENVTDSLWARLSRYMHVRQDVLRRTMWDFEQQHYIIEFVVAGIPDWDKLDPTWVI